MFSDTSRRKSYKEGDSIYLGNQTMPNDNPSALEFDQSSRIIYMLRKQHKIEYVIYLSAEKDKQANEIESTGEDLSRKQAEANGKSSASPKKLHEETKLN